MFIEILMALIFYKLFRRFLLTSGDGDDRLADVDLSDTDSIFSVASRLERVYGGKAYVGLRIPDPEIGSRRHIDLVLASTRAVMVVAVRNFSGYIELGRDGSWVCTKDLKHRPETFPDPVPEIHKQVEILEAYMEQRGVVLPKGHVIGKVVLPNPNCRIALSIASQPEVVSFDEWMELKPSSTKPQLSSWFKGAFNGEKGEMQDSLHQIYILLGTSPMWDRLELKGDRHMLGEFLEFKGTQEDMQALINVKRSKVGRVIIQKASMFGLGRSRIPLLYAPRDYRGEGSSSTEWAEVAVKPTTEVLFKPYNAKKPRKIKITSIFSISLSA